jgi:hypothetical protein
MGFVSGDKSCRRRRLPPLADSHEYPLEKVRFRERFLGSVLDSGARIAYLLICQQLALRLEIDPPHPLRAYPRYQDCLFPYEWASQP